MFYVRVLVALMLGLLCTTSGYARDIPNYADEFAPSPCIALTSVEQIYDKGLSLLSSSKPQDLYDAADCFIAGAYHDDAKSQKELARMYLEGIGVPMNPAFAYKWAIIADAGGDGEAGEIVKKAEKIMNQDDLDEARMQLTNAKVWRTVLSNWQMETARNREEAEEAKIIGNMPFNVTEKLRKELMEIDQILRSADFGGNQMGFGGGMTQDGFGGGDPMGGWQGDFQQPPQNFYDQQSWQ